MERSEQNLRDNGHEVDGVVVHLVAIFSIPTLLEPNLEARIDGEKELGVELLSRRSHALKVDLLQSIIVWRVRRHWEPTLSSLRKILLAIVNIQSCLVMSWKFIGA